jgi:hypothetical protein
MSRPAEVIKSFARRGEEGYSQTEALMAALELVSINSKLLGALETVAASLDEAVALTDEGKAFNQRWQRELKQARAAIAKAKGE